MKELSDYFHRKFFALKIPSCSSLSLLQAVLQSVWTVMASYQTHVYSAHDLCWGSVLHTTYVEGFDHKFVCRLDIRMHRWGLALRRAWFSSLLARSPLPLSVSLPSKSSHIVTWTVSVSPRFHSASQFPLLFHIHHPSGQRGDVIRLAPAEHVPTLQGGPQGQKRYRHLHIYTSSDSTTALQD